MNGTEQISARFALLSPVLDERMRRLWAAAEARVIGRGGPSVVSRATGISRQAIAAGKAELDQGAAPAASVRLSWPRRW